MLSNSQALSFVIERLTQIEIRNTESNISKMDDVLQILSSLQKHFTEIEKKGYDYVEETDIDWSEIEGENNL